MVNTLKRNKLFLAAILVLFSASFSFAAKQNTYTTKTAPTGSDKALIADAADSNKTKQTALSFALTGDCTGFPCLDGTSDGGNMIKLWAGTGSYWTALQGGAPAANRSWRLPIAAPPSAGTTYLMNMDEYGQMGFVDPATFLTPSGVGGALTVTATGFNGNLTTSDNTLQEIAQKVDDLVLGGTDTDDQTASEVAVTSSGFDGNLATTDNTVQKALQKLDDLTVTGGTDDQTASEVNITDAGLYFTGTTVEAALQEVGLDYAKKANYLALANTTAFTPDADYEPATKKYVDDSIVAGGSYTDEQAQDAVGSMFSGNTVTGITTTYDDATGKVNLDASHNHTGTYAPVLGSDDNYVTDAEKTKLTNLSGTNSGDNAVNSNYSSLVTNATHTGDVTGATALTIANSAVTMAKMANMATGSLIYRKTASSGAPEVNTLATLKTDLGLTGTNSGDQTTITGNAGTATALAANGGNCSAGQAALGVDASGAAEGCWTPSAGSMTWPGSAGIAVYGGSSAWGSSLSLVTSVGATGADTAIPTEQGVREALDLKANTSSIAFEAATWADLKILDTTHTTAGTGIALVQDSMAYGNADDAYHLWSIDKIGSELAGKQASDADLLTYASITPSANVQSLLGAATYAAMRTLLDLEAGTDFNAYDADIADLADGSLTGTKVGFADTDGLWTATNVQAALEELNDSINAGVPNGTGAKVHWSQILGVPAGFADGSDDGAGGTPTAITVADTTDTTSYVALFTDATGDLGPKTDAGLTYNAGTGMLTATGFTGPLTGTASGNLVSGGAAGTPSSITLTNGTGLPLSGVVDSTTEALGAGTIELGAASDTTIARGAAGRVTVESLYLPRIAASGSVAFDPASVSDGACSSATDGGTATGVATTDTINWNFNSTPIAVTGYNPSGNLGYIIAYPTADHVNFIFCNKSGSAIDAGSVTLNWMVLRP